MLRAQDYEHRFRQPTYDDEEEDEEQPDDEEEPYYDSNYGDSQDPYSAASEDDLVYDSTTSYSKPDDDEVPIDEAIAAHAALSSRVKPPARLDPPDDEPPSLSAHEPLRVMAKYYEDEEDDKLYESEESPMSDGDFTRERTKLHTSSSPTRPRPARVLPPVSPRTPTSGIVGQSPAMREAQEMIKRNRQRRLESTAQVIKMEETSPTTDEESGATWESTSDFTSSSVWTDGSTDKSSRRQLILQMAKARMKARKEEEKKSNELDEIAEDLD